MKTAVNSLLLWSAIWALSVQAQMIHVGYDQMAPWPCSPAAGVFPDGGFFINDQGALWEGTHYQLTQSFTPFHKAIDFIDLRFHDKPGDGRAPTVYIVLRSGSIDGPVIASTDPIALADGWSANGAAGWTRFVFPTRVNIAPFQPYYFQPMVQPGTGLCIVEGGMTKYTAGGLFLGTTPEWGRSLYFREGFITEYIPEPSTLALGLAGLPLVAWAFRRRQRS